MVRIRSGRAVGMIGYVQYGSNGYLSLKLSDGSEIMKRSATLELVDSPTPKSSKMEKREDEPKLKKKSLPDHPTGRVVLITEGKHSGEKGVVLRSGHGFICVGVGNQEVMKRAQEIELLEDVTEVDMNQEELERRQMVVAAKTLMLMAHHNSVKSPRTPVMHAWDADQEMEPVSLDESPPRTNPAATRTNPAFAPALPPSPSQLPASAPSDAKTTALQMLSSRSPLETQLRPTHVM